MKKNYLLLLFVFSFIYAQAQIIDIPNADFKNILLNEFCADTTGDGSLDSDVDFNNDGEIEVSEAEAVYILNLDYYFSLNSIEGIEYFTNLIKFTCVQTAITELDLSQNNQLIEVNCVASQLTSLTLANPNLEYLSCGANQLTNLDLSQTINLKEINCTYNELSSLDVTQITQLEKLEAGSNNLSSIDITNNAELNYLDLENNQLSSLDISQNLDLDELRCNLNQLTALDTSNNSLLTFLECENNLITSLDISSNQLLGWLNCNNNLITDLDISGNEMMYSFYSSNNQITTLEVHPNSYFLHFECINNNLESLIIKNNPNDGNWTYFENNPNLQYICVDDADLDVVNQHIIDWEVNSAMANTYCSFVPGGEYSTVEGAARIDLDSDGCDINDAIFPGLKFNVTDGINTGTFISNASGAYNIPLVNGTHTITPVLEDNLPYIVSPSSITVDFPTDGNPFVQDFCLTPNGVVDDLEVVIVPVEEARPGFDTDYKLIYRNKGNTNLSGSLSLQFNGDVMDLVSSNPIANNISVNNLEWNYSSLEPFETREIRFVMNLNTPTDPSFPLNGDDILVFNATLNPLTNDVTPDDNVFVLNQTVVNSFDPNDKRCLEGETITPELVGEYVHYMIRFENTGTASAINIVVKDVIDTNRFDINTLIPLHASHNFMTRIQNTNEVEFIFENINLPFDDANNDGFVVFKIKTLDSLVLGDTFANDAEIYFDFNAPIITNDYITTIEENLSLGDYLSNSTIKLFPNPVNDIMNISANTNLKSISVLDVNGRVLQTIAVIGNKSEYMIDLKALSKGVYFITVKAENGQFNEKIIKN